MEVNSKNVSKKSIISIALYVVAIVVALLGVALLVTNMLLFKSTVSQAVAQGYAVATVRKALLTSQLLPGIFQPVAVYGGIAFLLFGAGVINNKVSKCLTLLTKAEICNDIVQVDIVNQDAVNVENVDTTEQIKTPEEVTE